MTDLAPDVIELSPWTPPADTAPLREVGFRKDAWLPEEIATLRRLFADDASIDLIAAEVGRGRAGVADRIVRLGLRRNSSVPWGDLEDQEIVRRYGEEPAATIAQDLGRATTAVYMRAKLLGVTQASAPPWTAWEDAQLRAGFEQSVPTGQLAMLIGRPLGGAISRASKLGLTHPSAPSDWSAPECGRALELAEQGLRYGFIRQRLADEGHPMRSKVAFGQKIKKLGYGRGWGRRWTTDEDELLRRAYCDSTSLRRLAASMARAPGSLRWRAGHLGLMGTHANHNGFRQGPDWTQADMARLREAYGKVPSKQLAAELGRRLYAMLQKAHVMGLTHGYIRPWTEDEIAFVRAAWALPVSQAEVAAALGRKAPAVAKWTSKHGIRFDDANRPAKPSRKPGRRRFSTREEILALGEAVTVPPPRQ